MMQLSTDASTAVPPLLQRGGEGSVSSYDEQIAMVDAPGTENLGAVELEVIRIFVAIVKLLGIPKSVAEIYGVLFVTEQPLPLDVIVDRLRISKGSVSQGLKLLRGFGGVRTVYVAGDRRDHYLAETELKKLVAGFVRGEVVPRLNSGGGRLEHVQELTKGLPPESRDFLSKRVAKLQQWHSKSQDLLPLLGSMLDEEVAS